MIEIHWFLWMLVGIGCIMAGGTIGLLIMGMFCSTIRKERDDFEYKNKKLSTYLTRRTEQIEQQKKQEKSLRQELGRTILLLANTSENYDKLSKKYKALINKEV